MQTPKRSRQPDTPGLILTLALAILFPVSSLADSIRVATFNTELSRDGPGLLLRDILSKKDDQVAAVVQVVATVQPDILVLQGLDWDYESRALTALAAAFAAKDAAYPNSFAAQPNGGRTTGLDLDGDGRTGGPGDAQGYGAFTGKGGIAVLSRFPIRLTQVVDFSHMLWRDLPGAELPVLDGAPFPSRQAQTVQRLSSTAHWVIPIALPDGDMHLLTYQAGPPVFDGPEDRNGLRNRDENRFWQLYLDGAFGTAPPAQYVIAGGANLDPHDSDGRRSAIQSLLSDPRLQDPEPASAGAAAAPDQGHRGSNALDTVDWERAGRLRVDYILPGSDWRVINSGVYWPESGKPGSEAALTASRHRLVWVDLAFN
ncbi:MAG: endonuclease/exonuclease/phosphatase family protein [Pseudomonadota bacterium]